MPKHSKRYHFADLERRAKEIGDGYRRTEITLAPGETAWSPYSHKWVYRGPGTITYLFHPANTEASHTGAVTTQYV